MLPHCGLGEKTGTFAILDVSRLRFRKNCVNISEGAARIGDEQRLEDYRYWSSTLNVAKR